MHVHKLDVAVLKTYMFVHARLCVWVWVCDGKRRKKDTLNRTNSEIYIRRERKRKEERKTG